MYEKGQDASPLQEQTQAYTNQANAGIGGQAKSDHACRLRKQLIERRWKLESELREVDDALNTLNTDETVNKVLKVFEVAGK